MDGLITDCGAEVGRRKEAEGWFDVQPLKEPYRVEGKKTLGYELAEQMKWELPEVINLSDRGRHRLIGMWKAFDEMEQWVGSTAAPRMVTVQAAGCAPIVRAFDEGNRFADEFPMLRRPLPVARAESDWRLFDSRRVASIGGTAVAVTDES
jgi:threonine synthase